MYMNKFHIHGPRYIFSTIIENTNEYEHSVVATRCNMKIFITIKLCLYLLTYYMAIVIKVVITYNFMVTRGDYSSFKGISKSKYVHRVSNHINKYNSKYLPFI